MISLNLSYLLKALSEYNYTGVWGFNIMGFKRTQFILEQALAYFILWFKIKYYFTINIIKILLFFILLLKLFYL